MSVPWLIDLSQTRTAPDEVRRRLRELDPTSEVIYLGWNRWCVGRVRPTDESVRIAQRMLTTYWRLSPKSRATSRGIMRYRFAQACLQGFRPVHQYTLRDLDGRVVNEFRDSQWRMTHERSDLVDEWERAEAEEQAERRAQFKDEHRAKATLDYARQSNFGAAVSSIGTPKQPVRSGFTRIAIP